MPNQDNLVPHRFKKGQTGNPNGRPKKIPEIDKLLADKPDSEYEAVIEALFNKAKKGDVRAVEVLLDRAYGKADQRIAITEETVKSYSIGSASQRKGVNSK